MARWAASLKEKLWSFDSCLRLHQWARWDAVQFLEQMKGGIAIFNCRNPDCQALFVLDQSSNHASLPPDTLKAFEMNKLDGRKQCIQCDTIILMTNPEPSVCGLPQKITLANSQPKGLQTILTKHGFKVNKLWAKCSPVCPFKSQNYCMAQILSQQDNFINQESMIESLIKKEGHLVVFLPKFHCELNAIEMVSLDLQL